MASAFDDLFLIIVRQSTIYAKHQYRQDSEYESTVVIYIPIIIVQSVI